MRDLKLKRLDTSYDKYDTGWLKPFLVTDLPIFNNDGAYYSRALKRGWCWGWVLGLLYATTWY